MKKEKILKQMSGALEGAFAVVLAQNALLLSKPFTRIIENNGVSILDIIVILFAIINFLAITSNWVSCAAFSEHSNNLSFFNDIITLGLFFIVTQIIFDTFGTKNVTVFSLLILISSLYIIIHILFIIWNMLMLKADENNKQFIKKSNILNVFSISIFLFVIYFSTISQILYVAVGVFLFSFLYWLFLIFYFIACMKEERYDQ